MEALANYAMDSSSTKEESMLLRMSTNSVDFKTSAGDRLVGSKLGFSRATTAIFDCGSLTLILETGRVPDEFSAPCSHPLGIIANSVRPAVGKGQRRNNCVGERNDSILIGRYQEERRFETRTVRDTK